MEISLTMFNKQLRIISSEGMKFHFVRKDEWNILKIFLQI